MDTKVWFQVSRKHRLVARLPNGMTGVQALLQKAQSERPWDAEKWVNGLGEAHAGDYWLRTYAESEGLTRNLDKEEFEEFRAAGGDTYMAVTWKKESEKPQNRVLREFKLNLYMLKHALMKDDQTETAAYADVVVRTFESLDRLLMEGGERPREWRRERVNNPRDPDDDIEFKIL